MYSAYRQNLVMICLCAVLTVLVSVPAFAQNGDTGGFWVLNSSTEILAGDDRGFTKKEPGGWMGEIAFRKRADCLHVLEKVTLEAGYDTRAGLKAEVFFENLISRKFERVDAMGETQRFTIECRQSRFVDTSAWD